MRRTLALLPLLSAACTTIPDDLASRLTEQRACGDVVFGAFDVDDTWLLTLSATGVVMEALEGGQPATTTFDLAEGGSTTVIVEHGTRISDAICDDVIENGGPRVTASWTCTAGLVSLTITPGTEPDRADGEATLTDLACEADGGGANLTLDRVELGPLAVNWWPG